MPISFKDGAIVREMKFHEEALYDVSNNLLTAQFDGRFNLSKYAVVNKWDFIDCWYTMISLNGENLDYYCNKKVTMVGKIQTTEIDLPQSQIVVRQFVDNNVNAVFQEYEIIAKTDTTLDVTFNMGINMTSYLKNFFSARFSVRNLMRLIFGTLCTHLKGHKKQEKGDKVNVFRNELIERFYFDVAMSNNHSEGLESTSLYCNQYRMMQSVNAGENGKLRMVVSMGTRGDFSEENVEELFNKFDFYKEKAQEYADNLPVPTSCDTEFLKAYYKNLYNCSLSMYKEVGDFKGFLAGIVYQSPARTYFRDGYWTILSVISNRPDLVKNEILTLAKGIDKDGKCPSAVKYNFKNWWGNHYDSPSFFAIMLYDYVRITGDESILTLPWRGKTILDAAIKVVEKLAEYTDDTGLLYKGGEYNRRDWCDNVFRKGYCTYDEVLFARALQALSVMTRTRDVVLSESYNARYEKVKKAINKLLWNPKLGYYVNYVNEDAVEDNLSIDTVVAVLFGIADKEKSISMLKKMEAILESKNNLEQKAGDFGTLCVYPFYANNADVVLKSSYPYYYHNGGDWPYLSSAYAYAKLMHGMDYAYPLTRWWEYNLERGNNTPVEFFAPPHKDGSLLQAWSSMGAFVLSYPDGKFFD